MAARYVRNGILVRVQKAISIPAMSSASYTVSFSVQAERPKRQESSAPRKGT